MGERRGQEGEGRGGGGKETEWIRKEDGERRTREGREEGLCKGIGEDGRGE